MNDYQVQSQLPDEIKDVLDYLKNHKELVVFPYEFTENYEQIEVNILIDIDTGFKFVFLMGMMAL